ncbi:MAG TPA: nickel-dependent hydrogenase large subunit [Coriobacteriia bacterium]|nr:nickel-dependent hydrogenase large subunit [Coriobacteriia bacterium]
MPKVVIDPVTRIEGHLRVTCQVEDGKVVDAWNHALMFRGFEIFMKDRDPRDAWQFAQRICGVCPTPHAHASTLATEHAMGYQAVPDNARIVRNMFEATHVGYDHILWFYHLNAFDYVNVPDVLNATPSGPALQGVQDQVKRVVDSGQLGPFAGHWWDHPEYRLPPELNLELTAHYLEAIKIQQIANDAQAFIGGRFPMVMSYIPGGMQERLEIEEILYYRHQMTLVKEFVDTVMLQDLLAIAPFHLDLAEQGAGVGNYLSWGLFDVESQVPEDRVLPRGFITGGNVGNVQQADLDQVKLFTANSYYDDQAGAGQHPLEVDPTPQFTELPPLDGEQLPQGKYDWTKAARYGDQNLPMEVGPLADILVAYGAGRPAVVDLVNSTLEAVGAAGKPEVLLSNLGRIAARVLRQKVNVDFALQWADELLDNYSKGDETVYEWRDVPESGEGNGGWNAPRGALAHYMRIENGRIGRYAAVPPTNWNLSPRDDQGVRGPLEQALIGVPVVDTEKPLEILRTVHTFDP